METEYSIIELTETTLYTFFDYLAVHISQNGKNGNPLFAPLSPEQSILSDEMKTKFASGLNIPFGENGWRKAWIALNRENTIVGHIDLRANNQPNSSHRVLLGMGVNSLFRGKKVGVSMLQHVIDYCRNHSSICWLDLEVMSENTPAKNLYQKMEFVLMGETIDKFRIDNVSYNYTSMTLNVEH